MILKCSYCSKQFKFSSEKKRHEESHFVKYECGICKKTFNFDSALRRHEKQHERTDPVNCILCGHCFQDKILLKRHMEYAHQGETRSCSKCDATFGSDKALRIHAKSHQPKSQGRFCCSHIGCNKTFNFSHHLKHHELTHNNMKQHYCNVCGKGFIQLHHLKTHLKVHQPDKWISCNVLDCKKQFTNEYALRRHLKTHAKNNPEVLTFKSSSKMSSSNDKVLCNYCGKLITRKHLMKHNSKCGPSDEHSASAEPTHVETSFLLSNAIASKKCEDSLYSSESSMSSTYDIEVHNACKSAIGGCIVTGDSQINENCLCIKMSMEQDHSQEAEDILPKDTDTYSAIQKSMDGCEDCECSNFKYYNKNTQIDNNFNKKDLCFDLTPKENVTRLLRSELKEIKINKRNPFINNNDLPEDLSKNYEKRDIQTERKYSLTDFDNIPFNSCKAILGNCIVSGDQTIGEGCLCAKMSKSVTQSVQEFEEITPLSEMSWSN